VKKLILLAITICIFFINTAYGQTRTAEVRQIDALVTSLDAKVKRTKTAKIVFADTSDYEADNDGKWQRFASEKALERHRDKSETYTIAYVWLHGGNVAVTNFTLFSPSGDWAEYVYSYYRPDGTLARIEAEMRTFHGDYIAIRRYYLDRSGKVIYRSTKYLDLNTRKPKKPDPGYLAANPSMIETEHYKTTSNLPFIHLLTRK
jgi:hypothetical protein